MSNVKLSMSHEAFISASNNAYFAGRSYGQEVALLGMAAIELYHHHKRNDFYINRWLRTCAAVQGVTYAQARAWALDGLVAHPIEKNSRKVDHRDPNAKYTTGKSNDRLVTKCRGWRRKLEKCPDFREYKRAKIENKFDPASIGSFIESVYGRLDTMIDEHGEEISQLAREQIENAKAQLGVYIQAHADAEAK